ncbi:RDD family protein [Zooshikella ganghwensis]|uniref:RDD family protein n=1 Tax=Zooshikella ganghwensis TaxID=202772 RepID=UPI000484B5AC|nr:RDD family protein [Zooshikella ganghwensis]
MHSSNEIYQTPEARLDKPEEIKISELAPRWRRLCAHLIDFFICGLIATALYFFADFFILEGTIEQLEEQHSAVFELILVSVSMVFFFLINGPLLAKNGQTVGKKLLGIAIVSYTTNKILPLFQVILIRYGCFVILGFIPAIGQLASLVNTLFIFRKERRCLHDYVADSKVIVY